MSIFVSYDRRVTVIYSTVVELLLQRFTDYDECDVSAETSFEELGAGYEDIVDLAFALSRELDIILDEEDIDEVEDIGDLVEVVQVRVNDCD